MYILKLQKKSEKRYEQIIKILPTQKSEGLTITQITEKFEEDISTATIRQDLQILVAREDIQNDDSRRPIIYWRKKK